jgi:hypothetical protein
LAASYLRAALYSDPELPAAHYNLAIACEALGYENADIAKHLVRAVELDPSFLEDGMVIDYLDLDYFTLEEVRRMRAAKRSKKSVLPFLLVGTLLGAGIANKAREQGAMAASKLRKASS